MQAVILAGGAGTRLRPLTLNTPKPMLDVNGKPFLLYIVEELKKYNVKDIVLCVGYLPEKFQEFFGDGSKFGIQIQYSLEKEFLGTAGAIKLAEKCLADDFLVLNGDTYLPLNYADVYEKFRAADKSGMIVVYDNIEFAAEPNIAIDQQNNVIAYAKKEPLKKGDQLIEVEIDHTRDYKYVDAGVYVFKKEMLDLVQAGKFVSLEGDIYSKLIQKRQLKAYPTSERYYDLGTPERLADIRTVLK